MPRLQGVFRTGDSARRLHPAYIPHQDRSRQRYASVCRSPTRRRGRTSERLAVASHEPIRMRHRNLAESEEKKPAKTPVDCSQQARTSDGPAEHDRAELDARGNEQARDAVVDRDLDEQVRQPPNESRLPQRRTTPAQSRTFPACRSDRAAGHAETAFVDAPPACLREASGRSVRSVETRR